jgi:hypothetical protein
MSAAMVRSGLMVKDVTGVTFNILARVLQLAKDRRQLHPHCRATALTPA